MPKPMLKYAISEDDVNFILQSLNQVAIIGENNSQTLLRVCAILRNPLNKKEIDEAYALEVLKQQEQ